MYSVMYCAVMCSQDLTTHLLIFTCTSTFYIVCIHKLVKNSCKQHVSIGPENNSVVLLFTSKTF